MSQPFSEDSRTGFEIELLAPQGKGRRELATALAAELGGRVEFGFKYQSEGPYADGRPICDLTPSYRVHDAGGEELCTIVDDVTIRDALDREQPTPEGMFRIILDDLRLALWAEKRCWAEQESADAMLATFLETFECELGEKGGEGTKHPEHRVALTEWGHVMGVVGLYSGERHRAAEVVTRPLRRDERGDVIATLIKVARAEAFTVPREAALHLHLDRDPWRHGHRLRQLITDFSAAREMLYETLSPNPGCRRLGPFKKSIVDIAERAPAEVGFDVLKEQLEATKAVTKYMDLNILGVLGDRPRHPTLEFRCLPVELDAAAIMNRVGAVEEFLREVALSADDALKRSAH